MASLASKIAFFRAYNWSKATQKTNVVLPPHGLSDRQLTEHSNLYKVNFRNFLGYTPMQYKNHERFRFSQIISSCLVYNTKNIQDNCHKSLNTPVINDSIRKSFSALNFYNFINMLKYDCKSSFWQYDIYIFSILRHFPHMKGVSTLLPLFLFVSNS